MTHASKFILNRINPILYYGVLFGGFIICFVVARILYPVALQYSILTHTFSRLGDWIENPQGWVFFSIGLCWLGIGVIPLMHWIYRTLTPVCPLNAKLGIFGAYLTSFGLIGIALFADIESVFVWRDWTYRDVHNIVTILSLGGAALQLLTIGSIFGADEWQTWRSHQQPMIRQKKGVWIHYFAPWEWYLIGSFCLFIGLCVWDLVRS